MGIAISLFKRTKFNSAWILISAGFFLLTIYRVIELFPAIHVGDLEKTYKVQVWLSFIISLAFAIGVFYIRKLFQFLRRVDNLRNEMEKRVLSAMIRTEEKERQRFAKELHDGLGPLLSVIKMLLSGFERNNAPEVNEKIKDNLKQAVDEAIESVREISANISPHILNNFGLRDAISSFVKKLRLDERMRIRFDTNLEKQRFPYNVEVIMYRVVCELLNNTLRHAGAHVYLDADGDALEAGLSGKPFFTKPNNHELSALVGRELTTVEEIAAAAHELVEKGVERVVVSMGGEGALLATADETWHASSVKVPVGSTVGAGDSVVAALAYAEERGMSLDETARLAMATGAANVMQSGTQAAERDLVDSLLGRVTLEEL